MNEYKGRETEINFKINLDKDNLPEVITWKASDGPQEEERACKSIAIALWDKEERNTLRIDLWTKDMPIDEMHTYFLQNLMTLSDSYVKATGNPSIKDDMLAFCKDQAEKIRAYEEKRNQPK
ncbi:MAG: gliding motility protein GldC [Bacteroidetes bacterium]|nr:gliding motility protein GldC [Bacteroidota bacterium]